MNLRALMIRGIDKFLSNGKVTIVYLIAGQVKISKIYPENGRG